MVNLVTPVASFELFQLHLLVLGTPAPCGDVNTCIAFANTPTGICVNSQSRAKCGGLSVPQVMRSQSLADLRSIKFDAADREQQSKSPVPTYSVSKAMLNRATQLLAHDERFRMRGISVSAVTPGWVTSQSLFFSLSPGVLTLLFLWMTCSR